MKQNETFFLKHVISTQKGYVWLTLFIAVIYFALLRYLYPVPSYYSDSFTWIGGAKTHQPISMRPIGYSKLIIFFKLFSVSDIALIAGQFLTNLLANFFLFCTCTFFFPLKKIYTILLYILLIINPFYLFYCNYISSDAFFNCFTVIWFTLLIWIMFTPSWFFMICQLIVLMGLFELRYNAIYFPAITALAFLLTKMERWKKALNITITCIAIFLIIVYTTHETKFYTGTKIFSAFSGWQLANDGLHVLWYSKIDTSAIEDKEVKALLHYTVNYFDTTRQSFPDTAATAFYMWHVNSPLKKYMSVYPHRKSYYFGTWTALGPLYSKFGQTIILQKPLTYLQHFVLPNTKAYFFPPLEIYDTYMEDRDTIPAVAQKYFHYKTTKTPPHHPAIYAAVFRPMQYLFTATSIIFFSLGS